MSLVLLCSVAPGLAEQFGLFTYQVVGTTVEITDYPEDAVGPVEVPAEIAGMPVTSIGNYAFSNCSLLTNVTLPSSVAVIGDLAFSNCHGLTVMPLPSAVTSIGRSAFSSCIGLADVTIPAGVTQIRDSLFSRCTALTRVTIPSGVIGIGRNAFQYCAGLTSVPLPSSLRTIGDFAFFRCTSLPNVTIPSNVRLIFPSAFEGCTSLASILVEAGNPWYSSVEGLLVDGGQTTIIRCPQGRTGNYTVPSSITTIGDYAFVSCSGLTSITVPHSVTSISHHAFQGCTGLSSMTIPSSVTIPSRVTSIEWSAFYGCSGLTSAVFLGDAPSLGTGGFFNTAPGFTIYYLSGRAGFSSPTWNGNPATMIDEATWPAASWLLAHGFWYETDLHQDPNSDGVSLLMAYGLDLDPRLNLQGSLPVAVLGSETLSLTFHATSPGITYKVETSTDLQNWRTQGVTQSAAGPDQRGTATVLRDAPNRFLRLMVED